MDQDKNETIRRLMVQLITVKETNIQLQESHRIAIGARTAAVDKVRDLQDVLRLKERMMEDMEQQLANARSRADDLAVTLAARERELQAIRAEQASFPLSDMDLLHRHTQQTALFESIREALTCPVCYEPFDRSQAVSLLCGHTFCESCFGKWEARHLAAFKASPVQGAYRGPECPECRSTDVRRGRVRIWAMEEVVRLVERGFRDAEKLYEPPLPPDPAPPAAKSAPTPVPPATTSLPHPSAPAPPPRAPPAPARPEPEHSFAPGAPPIDGDGDHGMRDRRPSVAAPSVPAQADGGAEQEADAIDEDAASILRPRTPLPYGGSSR